MATLFGLNIGKVWLRLCFENLPHRAYRTIQTPHKHEVYKYFGVDVIDDNEQVLLCTISSTHSGSWGISKDEMSTTLAPLFGMPKNVHALYKKNQPAVRTPPGLLIDEFPQMLPAHYFEGVREGTKFDLGPLKDVLATQFRAPAYLRQCTGGFAERMRWRPMPFHDKFEQLTKDYDHTTDRGVQYLPAWRNGQ